MVKLKDIVANANTSNTGLAFLSSSISKSSVIATRIAAGITISGAFSNRESKDIVKFSEQAERIVTQDSFIDELDSKIGASRENESEDEFIARAKKEMRALLKAKLK
ncbi:hypothetical protein [Enterobacter sp.]|uniref:hypothetical protein n=1 Tax=Enterobacter sp. TaxID=42895 RepID=UPI00296EFE45|nr:hypothetical protein [Enterobacter sp.]